MANPAEPISGQICWPSPGSFTGHQRAHQPAAGGQNLMAIDTDRPSTVCVLGADVRGTRIWRLRLMYSGLICFLLISVVYSPSGRLQI
jgi:hypothetical protein